MINHRPSFSNEAHADLKHWLKADVVKLLMAQPAFANLSQEDAQKVVARMVPKRVKEGNRLAQEGFINADFLIFILEGEAVLENEFTEQTEPVVIDVIGSGAIIGELAVIDGTARSASCTAMTDMMVAILERPQLQALMQESPQTGCAFLTSLLKIVAERIRASNRKIRALSVVNRTLREELVSHKITTPHSMAKVQ